MRSLLGIAVGAFALGGLAACGESDEAFRSSYRTKAISECTGGARSRPNPTGGNIEQLCSCMIDGYMRVTPTERLKAERNQSATPAAADAARQQCLQQALQGRAAGTTPAANPQ